MTSCPATAAADFPDAAAYGKEKEKREKKEERKGEKGKTGSWRLSPRRALSLSFSVCLSVSRSPRRRSDRLSSSPRVQLIPFSPLPCARAFPILSPVSSFPPSRCSRCSSTLAMFIVLLCLYRFDLEIKTGRVTPAPHPFSVDRPVAPSCSLPVLSLSTFRPFLSALRLLSASFFHFIQTRMSLSATALCGVFQGYESSYTRLRDSASRRIASHAKLFRARAIRQSAESALRNVLSCSRASSSPSKAAHFSRQARAV